MDLGIAIEAALSLEGVVGVAIIDTQKSIFSVQKGNNFPPDPSIVTALYTEIMNADQDNTDGATTLARLEDVLLTFESCCYLMRPIQEECGVGGLCLFLVLDRWSADLDTIRRSIARIETGLIISPNEIEKYTVGRSEHVTELNQSVEAIGESCEEQQESMRPESLPVARLSSAKVPGTHNELPPFFFGKDILSLLGVSEGS